MAGLSITYHESRKTNTNNNKENGNRQEKKKRHGEERKNFQKIKSKGNHTNSGGISQSCYLLTYYLLHLSHALDMQILALELEGLLLQALNF